MFPSLSREPLSQSPWFAVEYEPRDHVLWLLDQRRLPMEVVYLTLRTPDEGR